MTKKQTRLILGAIILVVSLFAILFSAENPTKTTFGDQNVTPDPNVYDKEVLGASIFPTTASAPTPTYINTISPVDPTPAIENPNGYRVVKVVDGDTLDVDIDGKIERLRLIGIDTP